ncbi:phosphatidylglycerophosphate synthase [Opitutaceae bacterium TAV1]|nr:phosphatidylglycerophosphate synthase [Opitutaceae bacterium TAV1]
MTIYELKPRFQALLRPLARLLFRSGVTANHVTLGAMALSVAAGLLVVWQPRPLVLLVLPVVLFVRMALNAIDGMLAREFGQKSRLGAILNETTDVVSDAALYLPFAWLPGGVPWLVFVCVLLAALTEMIGLQGLTLGASRRYDGPMGKSDRAFVFGAYALVIACWPRAFAWSPWVFAVVGVLLVATCLKRARRALAEAARNPSSS